MRRDNVLTIFPLMMLIVSMAMVSTASSVTTTTISVEPAFIVDPTLVAGSTFTVDIVVTDVVDMYGYDFKLGYNTSILTATAVSFTGNIFEPGYMVWKNEIDDGLGRVWLALTQELGAPSGVSGSGLLATITFTVDATGDSYLHLYDTELRDTAAEPILHVSYDGYFRNAEYLYLADLVGRSAWPEHHHHVISKHGNINLLYGRCRNEGLRPVQVYVRFSIYDAAGGLLDTIASDTHTMAVGEMTDPALTADFDITDPRWGYTSPGCKYKVTAELFYLDVELGLWFEGSKGKQFSFAVVD